MKKLNLFCALLLLSCIHTYIFAQDTTSSVFGKKDDFIFSFKGDIYFLPRRTTKLPDFTKLNPVGSIYTNIINVPNQSFTLGFPGVTDRFEDFAIDYKAIFFIKEPTLYQFTLSSDDGSKLFIDDSLIISNDYQHVEIFKGGSVKLKKGRHKIVVQYYQGPRDYVALRLFVKKVDQKNFTIFKLEDFTPVKITEKDKTIQISLDDLICFDYNKSDLKSDAIDILTEIKKYILDKYNISNIQVEGHTDDKGTDAYNLTLSHNRANAVKNWMVSNGLNADNIIVKGYGETRPAYPNDTDENRAKNRRTEIIIER